MSSIRLPRIDGRLARWGALASLLPLLLTMPAVADDHELAPGEATFSGDLSGLSDAELERRVDWMTTRLEERKPYARNWKYAFTGAWSIGFALGVIGASTTSDHDDTLNFSLTAGKAAIGIGRLLLDPTPARIGAQPITEIQGSGRDALEARVRAGEAQMAKVTKRAERRWDWRAHAANVAINTGAGLAVLFKGNPSDMATQTGLGIVAGTVMLLTDPWTGPEDEAEYKDKFINSATGWPREPKPRWALSPAMNGLAFTYQF